MSGIASIVVGQRGSGKTTFSKKCLDQRPKNMPVIIYDINNEYQSYYPEPFEDFDIFLTKITQDHVRHYYILVEEATIFFSTRSEEKEMINVLVRARHTGNIVQLNFHSFLSIPKNIYTLLDYVTIFKTQDTEQMVSEKFNNPKIIEAFREVNSSPDKHFYKTVKIS